MGVVEGLRAWEEDTWKKVRIGHLEFHVWQRCSRCVMTTIDRDTLERSNEPMATLSKFREREQGCRNFGMHLIPCAESCGSACQISTNDVVQVIEYDEARKEEWERLYNS